MSDFLDPLFTSLKICGVTRADDAARLIDLGVHALGINFWSQSKVLRGMGRSVKAMGFMSSVLRLNLTAGRQKNVIIEGPRPPAPGFRGAAAPGPRFHDPGVPIS